MSSYIAFTELYTPQFPKVSRLKEVENGISKAWIKVERDGPSTRDGQMNRRSRQSREGEEERDSSSYFNHYSSAAVESPAVHALRPWAHAWPISLRSKRARFSKTYGLNNASALFPQGWMGRVAEKKEGKRVCHIFLFVYNKCISVCMRVSESVWHLWVCLSGTSFSTGQLASLQCQSLWLDSEDSSL